MFLCSYSGSPPPEVSAIPRLKRQLHRQKSPPKTSSVSSQVKYVAAINTQLRKGAWLQRSFTLSTLICSPRDEPAVVGRVCSYLVRIGLNASSQPVHAKSPG